MFEIGKRYNFNTLAPEVLGDRYKNALVLGVGSTKIFDIPQCYTINTQLLLYINNLDPDLHKHEIIVFEVDGERLYFSAAWIDINTILETTSFTLKIEVFNCNGTDDVVASNLLKSIGLTNIKITKEEVIL